MNSAEVKWVWYFPYLWHSVPQRRNCVFLTSSDKCICEEPGGGGGGIGTYVVTQATKSPVTYFGDYWAEEFAVDLLESAPVYFGDDICTGL